jgi:hypothetical protein
MNGIYGKIFDFSMGSLYLVALRARLSLINEKIRI